MQFSLREIFFWTTMIAIVCAVCVNMCAPYGVIAVSLLVLLASGRFLLAGIPRPDSPFDFFLSMLAMAIFGLSIWVSIFAIVFAAAHR